MASSKKTPITLFKVADIPGCATLGANGPLVVGDSLQVSLHAEQAYLRRGFSRERPVEIPSAPAKSRDIPVIKDPPKAETPTPILSTPNPKKAE